MQRTVRVILEPSAAQVALLEETCALFTSAFNQTVAIGWDAQISNATKLHYAAYYPAKTAHPLLVSDLVNQARVKAAEALRSAFALQKQGRTVSKPHASACPPRYNQHTSRVDWETRTVRLSTTHGRQTIGFRVPGHAQNMQAAPSLPLTCCAAGGAGLCISWSRCRRRS